MGEEVSVYMWEWWWGRRLVCTCGSGGRGGGFTQLELASYSCQLQLPGYSCQVSLGKDVRGGYVEEDWEASIAKAACGGANMQFT